MPGIYADTRILFSHVYGEKFSSRETAQAQTKVQTVPLDVVPERCT